jgi:hypothetical protein
MVNALMQQAQHLKTMIEQAKQQSLISKETALQQQRMQLEKEKQDVGMLLGADFFLVWINIS